MYVDFLLERFESHADDTAVIASSGRCTYGDLVDAIGREAAALKAAGIGAGTVTRLEGDFSRRSIALFLALAEQGAIVVPRRCDRREEGDREAELAEVEATVVERDGEARIAHSETAARHELYEELRRRGRPGLVQFSSGTSGEPKAAVHDLTLLLEKFETPRPALSALAFLLFDHLGGINTMLHTLSNGGALATTQERSPDAVCATIAEHRIELLPATPTFLNLLLLSGAYRRHEMSSLRVISYGAEPMPAATLGRLHAAFPQVKLQQTYGMVELGAMRTRSRGDDSPWVSVGGEGFETRVVDGRLQVRARSMLLGYLNAPTPLTADGWLETGDAVEADGGYLRFLGRDSDLINVGGEKVYPAEVEGAIESIDGIVEATVWGEPSALVGQFVCARATTEGPLEGSADELKRRVKRHCRERLERFKVPVRVEIVAAATPEADRVKKSRRSTGEAH